MNDVMLVLKPTDFGGKSSHSTYENDILGEVVGVPDKKVNSFEIMPDSIKSKYSEALKESQKAQVVAPYGIGVREVSPAKRKQKKKSKKITTKQIIGKPKRKKIVVDEVAALKDQIRLEARAAREAKRDLNARRKELAEFVKDLKRAGKISTNQARAIIGKLSAVNLDNTKAVDSFISYIDKVYADAEYAAKVVEANGLRKKIKKKGKTKKADAKLIELAKSFSAIDPRFVENIDEYIETANSVLEGVIPSRVVGTDIKWRTSPSIIKVNEYIENQLKVQEKAILDLKKAEFESITGIDPKDLSFKDMMDILSGEKEVDPDKEKIIRDNVNKAFNAYKAIIQSILNTEVDPFTGDKLNLTDSQIETIKDFINMDLSLLSVRDAISAVDSLNNFITNGSTGGMVSTFKIYKGSKNAKELADKGINASKLKLFFSKKVGRLHSEQIVSIPIMFERMFKGVKRGGKVMKMMGFTDTVNSTNRARREVTDTIDQYSNKFSKAKPNNQAFNTALNITERGVLGFMRRTVVGNKEAQNKEFERRKGLIKQSIDYLMNEGTEQEQKRGREYKEVYDKILEDSTSIEQMESKASNINLEAVRWWNNTWASKYEQLSDTSLNVYNKILGSDINYIPDIFRKTDITDPGEFNWEDSAFSAATNTLYQKKIGVLEEATRPGKLPKNRYISLDFDTNNLSTLQGALVDIYTAPSIKQIKGFMESDSFSKLFPSREDRDILERRIKRYVRSVRGKDYVTRSELNNFKRLIEFIAGLGVTRALGGVTQPVKQTVPVAINTLINAGRLDIMSSFNPEIQKFLNESGYAIANRGIASETTLDNINKAIDKAAKNSLSKTVNIIEDLNRKWLKVFLVNPDAYIARASWISYYKQYLNKKGVDTQGIDWSTHELNEGAADYAQQQVDRQQNISDSDLQGEFFASKSPGVQIAKKIIVPFMNFVINQKSRMYSDMIILGSKTASVEDRKIAARSLSGLLAETAAFNGVKWGIYSMLITPIVYSLLGVDESDEEKEKRENFLLKMSVTNAFLDIASPFPTLDYPLLWGANKALDLIQTDIKEEDRFQFWNKDSEDFAESLGVLGIAGKKVMDLIDIGDMYFTGEYEQEFFGKKVIKKLDKEQQDVMGVMLILGALYNIGLAPSETSTVVNQVVRNVKKKGKTEKQIEGERKKVSKEASEYSRTRGKRSRGTSRPRTSRGTSR